MKRGAIELPAVMIFIIIAGSFIMLFFIVLVMNQGESANKSIQATSLQRLDALLKGAGTARESMNNLTISDEPLHFTCEEFGKEFGGKQTTATLSYDSGVQTQLFNQVFFSPAELAGGQLRTYTKGATQGYRVTTVLYAATTEYIIQNATPSLDYHDFPPNFPYRNLSTAAEIAAADIRWRVIVTQEQYDQTAALRQHPDVVVVNKRPEGYGSVQYYKKGEGGAITYYPNQELLYGALLSEDAETYNCMLTRYLQQLKWVNNIERERLVKLKEANIETGCYPYYQEFPYNDIATVVEEDAFSATDAQKLAEAANQIKFMNDNLIRGGGGDSCAWLY